MGALQTYVDDDDDTLSSHMTDELKAFHYDDH